MLSKKQIKENIRNNPEEIKNIQNPSEDMQLAAVSSDLYAIQYIQNPCESVIRYVLKRDPFLVRLIENPSKKTMRYALFIKEEAIRYIHDPYIQKELLLKNNAAFRHIQNPTEDVQTFYVKRNYINISFIKDPPETLQLAAIEAHIYAFTHIVNPSLQTQWYCLNLLQQNKLIAAPHFFPKNILFYFIINSQTQDALTTLTEHKTFLQNDTHFENFIMFLLQCAPNDINVFLSHLQPLSTTQKNIWNKYRLRTII